MVYCPECGQSNVPNAKFCRHCGAALGEVLPPVTIPAPPELPKTAPRTCLSCGNTCEPEEKFCGNCGGKIGETSAAVPAVPLPPPVAVTCPACGTPTSPEMKFCGNCGGKIGEIIAAVPFEPSPPPVVLTCPSCGTPMSPEMKFCGACGTVISPAPSAATETNTGTIFPPPPPPIAPETSAPAHEQPLRLCRSCGNPIKPGEKFCSKCCAIIKDETASAAPHVIAAPPQPVLSTVPVTRPLVTQPPVTPPTCGSCGSPIAGTEKFCGDCGIPVIQAPPPAPEPIPEPVTAPPPAGKFCGSCGAPVQPTTKFCGVCGTPAGTLSAQPGFAPAAPVSMGQPIPSPVGQVYTQPAYSAATQNTGNAESVIGVIGNARKTKMFGVSYDTYTVVVTNRRMIFAQMTQAMMNAAIAEAQAKAKAGGKGFFGIMQDQLAASFGFAQRYETMAPELVIRETTGNIAIENSRISAIKMKLKEHLSSGTMEYHEFSMVIESMDGKFEYMIAEDERFTNLLKMVYGERLHMPFGYFSKAGVRIRFF